MSDFDQKKQYLLQEIGLNSETNLDASPKGTIDALCIPLITLINSHKDMVTTSSCSGRLSVFLEGSKETCGKGDDVGKTESREQVKIGAKGDGGHWLFVSHEKDGINEWWKSTEFAFAYETEVGAEKYGPSTRLYSTAMGCGFRESGIGANNNVAIRISIKLDIPIGYLNVNEELISVVNESYLRMITKLAHDRFLENERKMELLYTRIKSEVVEYTEKSEKVETKEERKERKRREGLARRDDVRKIKEEKRRLKQLQQPNAAQEMSK